MAIAAFDGCVVINLPHRTDRWERFQKQLPLLASLGLKPERMDAVYGRKLPGFGEKPWFTRRISDRRDNAWAGKAGCTLSHRNAIALAKDRGWKNVLILEDDACFDVAISKQWTQLIEMMNELPRNWVAIYLYGNHPSSPIRVVHSSQDMAFYEIGGANGTVAYVLNARYFDDLLKLMPSQEEIWSWTSRHKTIDRYYARQLSLLGPVFAVAPFGIAHLETPSDATTAGVAYTAHSFDFTQVTQSRWFDVYRLGRCLINRSVLYLSFVRQRIKKIRGL